MAKQSRSKRSEEEFFLTQEGFTKAKAELEFLKTQKRLEITERIKNAREFGNLAENSEYDSAVEEQALLEAKIAKLERVVKKAKIISKKVGSEFVVIGSTVKIDMDGEIDEFTIVGRVEADPAKKRISNESPLGTVLLGAKTGETVEVTTPIVKYKCKVLEVK